MLSGYPLRHGGLLLSFSQSSAIAIENSVSIALTISHLFRYKTNLEQILKYLPLLIQIKSVAIPFHTYFSGFDLFLHFANKVFKINTPFLIY